MREFVPSDRIPFEEANIDWEKTLAYSYARWGEIYVNLEGREPKGIVKPGKEYEEIKDFIIRELKNITDPLTGKQLDVKVFRKEEIYFGEDLDYAPDLFLQIDNFKTWVSTAFGYDSIFYPVTKDATWMGSHG